MNYMKRTKVMLLAVFEFLSAVFATSFFSLSFSIGKRSTLAGASPPPPRLPPGFYGPLHLPNYLRYYAALVCTNCIFSHLFS